MSRETLTREDVLDAIKNRVNEGEEFSAFDVTRDLRSENFEAKHSQIKLTVHSYMKNVPTYSRYSTGAYWIYKYDVVVGPAYPAKIIPQTKVNVIKLMDEWAVLAKRGTKKLPIRNVDGRHQVCIPADMIKKIRITKTGNMKKTRVWDYVTVLNKPTKIIVRAGGISDDTYYINRDNNVRFKVSSSYKKYTCELVDNTIEVCPA